MKIILYSFKRKLDTCKKFGLNECWVGQKNASLTDLEAGCMQ